LRKPLHIHHPVPVKVHGLLKNAHRDEKRRANRKPCSRGLPGGRPVAADRYRGISCRNTGCEAI